MIHENSDINSENSNHNSVIGFDHDGVDITDNDDANDAVGNEKGYSNKINENNPIFKNFTKLYDITPDDDDDDDEVNNTYDDVDDTRIKVMERMRKIVTAADIAGANIIHLAYLLGHYKIGNNRDD